MRKTSQTRFRRIVVAILRMPSIFGQLTSKHEIFQHPLVPSAPGLLSHSCKVCLVISGLDDDGVAGSMHSTACL